MLRLALTPDDARAVPFDRPVVPTGVANQLFSSVTPEIGPELACMKMSYTEFP